MNGGFVISLDFELYWGVRDSRSLESYQANILGVQQAIPEMLKLFQEFNVKATFATVGLLFFDQKEALMKAIPSSLPVYSNDKYNWYPDYLTQLGTTETTDPFHYGKSLIEKIRREKIHEIATHTFSHYYTLEDGAKDESFRQDLRAARKVAEQFNLPFNSIVFPRNQYNADILKICKEEGLKGFRGTEKSSIYKSISRTDETKLRRLKRLADAYVNLTGFNTYEWNMLKDESGLYNIPSSAFLRPYSKQLSFMDGMRLSRIKKAMNHAAQHNQLYHIWWHPHNFGIHISENLSFLRAVLEHYKQLKEQYNFESYTMNDCYKVIQKNTAL